jgi:positive regulator of sigma E activity
MEEMERANAEQLIGGIEEQRRRARKALAVYWFPLVVFGGFALIASLALELGAHPAILALWLVAGPVGIIATSIYYGRRTHRIGLSAPPLPFIVTGITLGVGAGLTGWLGRDTPAGYAGPLLVIGAGYLVFAWLQRSLLEGTFSLALMVAAVGFYFLQPPHALSLSLGLLGLGSLLVAALNLRQVASAG